MKRTARRALLLLAVGAAFLLCAEGIQRLRYPTVGFRNMTNSLGLRSPEFDPQKSPGATRILFAGGSTTFGVSGTLEETYPFLTGEILKKRFPGRYLEVVNIGLPGGTSYQVLERIKKMFYLEPDLLVVMVGGNDAATIYLEFEELRHRGDLKAPPWPTRLEGWIAKQSVLYVTFKEKISVLRYGTPLFAFGPPPDPEKERKMEKREWFEFYPGHFRKNMEKIIALAGEKKTSLLFVDPGLSPQRIAEHPLYEEAYRKLMETLGEVAAQHQIPFLEIKNFYETSFWQRLVDRDGLHFALEGKRKLAGRVSREIIRLRLLSSGSPQTPPGTVRDERL